MADPRRGEMVAVDGLNAHVHVHGANGPPVVLLHGCGSLAQEILPPFLDLPCRIYAVDRPGYGFSDPLPAGSRGPDCQADWLDGVLRALRVGPALVVGHSLGAAPALIQAARRPDRVKAVLLLAPYCRPTPQESMPMLRAAVTPGIGPVVRKVVPLVAPFVGPRKLAQAIHPNPLPDYLVGFPFAHAVGPTAVVAMASELRAFNRCMEAAEAEIAGCAVPVRVLQGTLDTVARPDWHLPWLAGLMPATTVTMLDGVGHAPHHAEPDVVRAAVVEMAED